MLNKIELILLWIVRILFAPNHFKVPLHKRIRYSICGGFMVDQVAMYDFPKSDKHEYLSEFDWHKSRHINAPYSSMLNNKVVFGEIVSRYCPSPEIYAVERHGRIVGTNGNVFSYPALFELLKEKGALVIKPVDIGKGSNIHILKWENGEIIRNGVSVTQAELTKMLSKSHDWFVCAYAKQADYLMNIFPDSANTIRMIVLRSAETHEFELSYAVQRIGASWTGAIDNGSQGGLIAKVDIESGEMTEARTLHNLEVYDNHPDTGAPIKGVVIPNWESIKKGVLEVSSRFPYLDIIAWDILPTEDGFTVIEANTSSGVNIIQLWGGQRNGRLGEFYREHGIIK